MKFKRQAIPQYGIQAITVAPTVNVLFLLLIFFAFISVLTSPPGINVKLPRSLTSDIIKDNNVVITITGENVIYLDQAVVTIDELWAGLKKHKDRKQSVLIKADRRTSLGRIVDVWDICRMAGVERINIATNQEQ